MSGPPAISLFSGVGGLDLGMASAGFDVRVALEYEADAAQSLRANDPHRPVIERSIIDVSSEDILGTARLRRGEAALVFGGPPCTPFSKSGYWLEYKRRGLDPNASLVDDYARVVADTQPETFLLENVHGLAYDNHNRLPFERLLAQLRAAGYGVSWTVLNAAAFGVPQLRKRLFVWGLRGAVPPAFPPVTHSGWTETRREFDRSLWPFVTAREAIGDLESRQDLVEPEEVIGGRYGHLLPEVPPGENYLFYTERRGHPNPLFRWRSRYWTFLLKLDPERPATTLQSQPGPYIGPFHWGNRRLRLLEVKRLQSFPDDYLVVGSRRSAQMQLGNAVPPKLAQVLGRSLLELVTGERTDDGDATQKLVAVAG